MGSAVTVHSNAEKEDGWGGGDRDDNASKHVYFSMTAGLSTFFVPRTVIIAAPSVSRTTQALCRASWNDIEFFIGKETFCIKFFQIFDSVHPAVSQLFRPRKKARNTWKYHSRWELLMNVVHFFLKLSDSSFKTKKKLRSIGRKHFLSGVNKEHVNAFNDVLIICFQSFQCPQDIEIYTRPWLELLGFCAQEMYVEDIHLVKVPFTSTPVSTP